MPHNSGNNLLDTTSAQAELPIGPPKAAFRRLQNKNECQG
jgi:hypothetical protein